MNEWNIQSRARACQACGKPFADKEAYHTMLFEQKAELVRQDVCANCWENQYSQGAQDRKGFISHWQGIYEAPPPAAPEPIQKDTAEGLLRKLVERNDPQYLAVAFILAVMLERKRLLKVKEQIHREGRRIFVYEQTKTGDVFTIPDPNLQFSQLDKVHRDVAWLLEHGLEPQPPGATTPADIDASTQPPGVVATESATADNSANQVAPAPVEPPNQNSSVP
jgi:hypothetical protein